MVGYVSSREKETGQLVIPRGVWYHLHLQQSLIRAFTYRVEGQFKWGFTMIVVTRTEQLQMARLEAPQLQSVEVIFTS